MDFVNRLLRMMIEDACALMEDGDADSHTVRYSVSNKRCYRSGNKSVDVESGMPSGTAISDAPDIEELRKAVKSIWPFLSSFFKGRANGNSKK
jgi:hypothetical protein